MQITVNGQREEVEPCTISQFVQSKGLKPEALVVEHNQEIVKQERWAQIQLNENDALELLSFVGGG